MRGEGIASNEVDSTICFSPSAAVRGVDRFSIESHGERRKLLDGGISMAKKKAAKKAVKKVAKKTAKKKAKK